MQGWLLRFKGGPFDGMTAGPAASLPGDDVIVWMTASGDCGVMAYDHGFMENLAEGVARYRLVRKSELTDEQADNPHLVRGAEYEEVGAAS